MCMIRYRTTFLSCNGGWFYYSTSSMNAVLRCVQYRKNDSMPYRAIPLTIDSSWHASKSYVRIAAALEWSQVKYVSHSTLIAQLCHKLVGLRTGSKSDQTEHSDFDLMVKQNCVSALTRLLIKTITVGSTYNVTDDFGYSRVADAQPQTHRAPAVVLFV